MTEDERACGRRDVDHQHQQDGLLGREVEGLVGVDRRQRDDGLDAGLVQHGADQEALEVGQALEVPQRVPHLRPGAERRAAGLRLRAFAQQKQGRQARQQEQRRRDQHGNRDEGRRPLPVCLRPVDVGQARAERHQPAYIAERPAPARHPSQRTRPREFGQEGGDQVFAGTEEIVGQHQPHNGERQRARHGEIQQRGEPDATQRGQPQQHFLVGMGIGMGTDQRRGQHHQCVGNRQGERPDEGRPRRVAGHGGDEIGAEDGGDDDRGVARIGEVVHRPRPDLAPAHAGLQQACPEPSRRAGHQTVSSSACCCSAHMWAYTPFFASSSGCRPRSTM